MNKINVESIKSILLVCPNWVGDFVMATPIFQHIRLIFPDSHIGLLAKSGLLKLSDGADWCDTGIVFDRKGLHSGLPGMMRLRHELRTHNFELVIVLPNSIRSGFIAKLSGARYRIGYDRPLGALFLTHRIKRDREGNKFRPTYMGYYYAKLVDAFLPGKVEQTLNLPNLVRHKPIVDEYWGDDSECGSTYKIAIAPGASFGSSKLWPSSHFTKLVDLLGEAFSPQILLVPGPEEEGLAKKIRTNAQYPVSILPASVGDLGVLKSIFAKTDLVICNDSGSRHVAHAFGINTIVLMGPTDPRHSENPTAPYQVLRNPVDCSPCHLKQCPFEHHACMVGITPERVFESCKKYLSPIEVSG